MTEKTLVIVLSETRESGLTFDNFKKNVIDQLNADLCLCIGVKPNYDYNNPFYKLAKYKFTYDEPEDFASAFDYAYNDIIRNHPRYEIFTIFNSTISIESIEYRRKLEKKLYEIMSFVEKSHIDSNEFVYQSKKIQYQSSTNELWENELSTIENNLNNFVHEDDVIIFKKHLNWREFLKIKNQFLGGIKAGVKEFIYPTENEKDYKSFMEKYENNDIIKDIVFHPVNNINEVFELVFEK